MTDYPTVSVAIITYNQRPFLVECLESVLRQDYPALQIVVADDASVDGTPELLRCYAQRFPGLFTLILAEKNGGVTVNSNRAHLACTGKYIAWLGGDDLMLAGKISKQVRTLEDDPDYVACFHDLDVFDSSSGESIRCMSSTWPPSLMREGSVEEVVLHGFGGPSSLLVRRSATPAGGFDERVPVASDWLYLIDTLVNGRMAYIPEVLGRYRLHGGNATAATDLNPDHLTTLRIVDDKYPHLQPLTKSTRAVVYYNSGVKAILAGQWRQARAFLLESRKWGRVSWKWWGWFLRTWVHM